MKKIWLVGLLAGCATSDPSVVIFPPLCLWFCTTTYAPTTVTTPEKVRNFTVELDRASVLPRDERDDQ